MFGLWRKRSLKAVRGIARVRLRGKVWCVDPFPSPFTGELVAAAEWEIGQVTGASPVARWLGKERRRADSFALASGTIGEHLSIVVSGILLHCPMDHVAIFARKAPAAWRSGQILRRCPPDVLGDMSAFQRRRLEAGQLWLRQRALHHGDEVRVIASVSRVKRGPAHPYRGGGVEYVALPEREPIIITKLR